MEKSRREWRIERGGERGLKYDIMKSELKYTFYKFTSWTKCPLRESMHGTKIKHVLAHSCFPALSSKYSHFKNVLIFTI
jgi:hypothetical protein